MGSNEESQPPLPQRLYDKVWLLAVLALVFWTLTYVVWGLIDVFSIPAG